MEWVTTTAFLDALKQPGDNEAWRRFVQRFRQPVVRYAERGGLKATAAEDLAQEVLLTFVESWRDGRYDPSKGRLSSWLFGIASKKLMSLRRRAARDQAEQGDPDHGVSRLPDGDAVEQLESTWEAAWQRNLLLQAMNELRSELKPDTLQAMVLTVFEKISAEAVAEKLDMTANSVYLAKSRGMARLRELVRELDQIQ